MWVTEYLVNPFLVHSQSMRRELNKEQDEKNREALKGTLGKRKKGNGALLRQGQRYSRAGTQP